MGGKLLSFEIWLNSMNYNFAVIEISETWLRDYNCNLSNIENDIFTEVYRPARDGGVYLLVYLLRMMYHFKFELICLESLMYMNVFC